MSNNYDSIKLNKGRANKQISLSLHTISFAMSLKTVHIKCISHSLYDFCKLWIVCYIGTFDSELAMKQITSI